MRYTLAKTALTLQYKETCRTLKKLVQKTRIDYEKRIIEDSIKLIFAYISNQTTNNYKIRSLKNEKGEMVVNKNEIANLLNNIFYEAFRKNEGEIFPEFARRCEVFCELDLNSFSAKSIFVVM